MLWHPPQKKGNSRCFKPKWSGPWTITHLIGDLNCKLVNEHGIVSPTVHVNQLKYIPPRSIHLVNNSPVLKHTEESSRETFCEIFADLNNTEPDIRVDITRPNKDAGRGGMWRATAI